MPSDILLLMMLFLVFAFCAILMYIYKTWSWEAKQSERIKQALEDIRVDLTRTRSELEREAKERGDLDSRVALLKKEVAVLGEEKATDKTSFQGLINRFESQMEMHLQELEEKNKRISQLEMTLEIYQRPSRVTDTNVESFLPNSAPRAISHP
ncbi:MAG: hypothetical protein HYY14_04605 [Candidatus Omnitrophica bacterium]|nr:hypothetical protein [Candidatus Omnitrophota bacterium]